MMLHQRPQLHISTRWIGLVVTLALAATAASADDGVAPDMVTLLGVRSATVAPNGAAFITFGAASRRDTGAGFVAETDSALGLGYTIGDAGTGIGLQFGVSFTGLSQGLGSSGQLSLKAGHLMRGSRVPTFIGVSVEHLAAWGTSSGLPVATSAMITWFPTARIGARTHPMILSLGYGDHVRNGGTDPGAFVGAGLGLDPNFGLSAAWTGDSATIGLGYRSARLPNWRFSGQIDDVFDQNASRRVTVSATYLLENAFGG